MRALVDIYFGLVDNSWELTLIEVPLSENYTETVIRDIALHIFESEVMDTIEGEVCFFGVYHIEYDSNLED